MTVDLHQHLWPEPLLAALSRRQDPPCIRRSGAGWVARPLGEIEAPFDPADHDPDARAALVRDDGLDHALLALSSPLGIEALAAEEAEPLLEAWHDGAFALGNPFGIWGAIALADPRPDAVDALIDRGAVGVSLAAAALASLDGLERCSGVLAALERHDAPLLVHPGPAPWRRGEADAGSPPWWAAMVTYLADLHAAWHAFIARGRAAHPRLRVLFVALAGGAPTHLERLAARGGPAEHATDAGIFYDASSYGPGALDAAVRVVGLEQIGYGSDRPVVGATRCPLGPAAARTMSEEVPERLLGPGPGSGASTAGSPRAGGTTSRSGATSS
jgi:hypothetical protein